MSLAFPFTYTGEVTFYPSANLTKHGFIKAMEKHTCAVLENKKLPTLTVKMPLQFQSKISLLISEKAHAWTIVYKINLLEFIYAFIIMACFGLFFFYLGHQSFALLLILSGIALYILAFTHLNSKIEWYGVW